QEENRMTELMILQEQLKTFPFGYVWDEYCLQCGVDDDLTWYNKVKDYEENVLIKRN
ncbi:MAG: L-rhamnose isomerase, partial [Eubacterium sp.]|nr:L-rhamnose isomerase [Eubacterium sp.]